MEPLDPSYSISFYWCTGAKFDKAKGPVLLFVMRLSRDVEMGSILPVNTVFRALLVAVISESLLRWIIVSLEQ